MKAEGGPGAKPPGFFVVEILMTKYIDPWVFFQVSVTNLTQFPVSITGLRNSIHHSFRMPLQSIDRNRYHNLYVKDNLIWLIS